MAPEITIGVVIVITAIGYAAIAKMMSKQYKPKTRQDIRLECLKMAERNSGTHRAEDIAQDGEFFFEFTTK